MNNAYITDFQNIKVNAAVCHDCDEYISSKHRHDFATCSCGNVSVDGGDAYIRRSVANNNWTDFSEFENIGVAELKEKISRQDECAAGYNGAYYTDLATLGRKLMKEWYGVTYSN